MSAKNQLLAQYDLHNVLFNTVLADINEEESNVKLVPTINDVKWLAGHLLWAQTSFAKIGGVSIEIIWIDHYNTQIPNPPSPEIKIPSLTEIKEEWNRFAEPVRQGLAKIPEEKLAEPFEFPLPQFKTLEGFWAFLNHHQAYTIGQIGILRRALGKEAMKYF